MQSIDEPREPEALVLPEKEAPAFSGSAAAGRLRSGVWQMILSQVVSSITPLLLVSLYLRAWGPITYGRWLSLTSLVSYLTLLDLGGQTFIGNLAAMDFARGDIAGMREKLSEGLSIFVGIAVGAFGLLSLFLLALPHLSWHGKAVALLPGDRGIVLLMAGAYLLAIPGSIFAVSYRSSGLIARGTAIGTYSRLGSYVLYTVALLLGVSPVAYAGVYMLAGVLGTAVVVMDAPRHIAACRGLRVRWSLAKKGVRNLSGSLLFWLLSVANAVNQQGVVLVLAGLAGPEAVVAFVTHRIVANALLYISNIFQGPVYPEMTFLEARGNLAGLTRLLKITLKIVVLTSASAGLLLWFAAPYAYRIWTRHKVAFDPLLLAILLAQMVLTSAWNTSSWSLIAVNRHKGLAYWNSANAAITILLALLLVPHYGVYGAAGGSLLGDIVCGLLVYPILAARLSKCSPMEIYGAASKPLLVVVALGAGLVFVRMHAGSAVFLGTVALALAVAFLLASRFVFEASERVWLERELRRILRMKPKLAA